MSTLISDGFDRTEASGWGDAEAGSDTNKTWEQLNIGSSSVGSSVAVADASDSNGLCAVGDDHSDTIVVTVDVATQGGANPLAVGPALRIDTGTGAYYAFGYSNDLDTLVIEKSNSQKTEIAGYTGAPFKAKLRAETVGATVVLTVKYWTSGDEPAEWTMGWTDSTSPLLSGQAGVKLAAPNPHSINSFLSEDEAAPEPDPGLPGGAVDESRRGPQEPDYSRTSLKGNFARGPRLPPPRPVPADVMRIFKSLGRR
jgi:hypothetical protein